MTWGTCKAATAFFATMAICATLAPGGPAAGAQEIKGTALQACLAVLGPPWNEKKYAAERLVWEKVCREEPAVLAKSRDAAAPLDAKFLRAILTRKRYLSVIPPKGVRIQRALFKEHVDLADISVPFSIQLNDSRLDGGASFANATVERLLTLDGTKVSGTLNMEELTVDGSLLMRTLDTGPKASFADIVLRSAKIGGQLSLTGATVSGKLYMDKLSVGTGLFMRTGNPRAKASFADIVLRSAKIGGQLNLNGATVSGTLNMATAFTQVILLLAKRQHL